MTDTDGVTPAEVAAAREAGRAARATREAEAAARADSNGAAPTAPEGAPRGLSGPALAPAAEAAEAAEAPEVTRAAPLPDDAPCGPCEDGYTLGDPLTRRTEKMLGAFGIIAGVTIGLIGLDLWTGGALSRILGLGGNDGNRGPD